MTVIKINAIIVGAGSGDELAHRFAERAGEATASKPVGVHSELWSYTVAVTN
ncbi:MAG: hypothetical protein M3Y06_11880 [Actinomycetota bacterium]|nr:hypothetical protein [Actinomycetota bacterium]